MFSGPFTNFRGIEMMKFSSKLVLMSLILAALTFSVGCGGTAPASNSATEATNTTSDEGSAPVAGSDTAATEDSNAANSDDEKAPQKGVEEIKFKPGSTSGSVKGSVEGYDRKDFSIRARKGQKMTVKLKSASTSIYFNIADSKDGFAAEMGTDPIPMDVKDWTGVLPKDGEYFIRVYLVRAAARRGAKADFTLDVSITGNGGGEQASRPKPNWFDCRGLVDVPVTFMEKGGKRIAEIEIGDTVLRLPATSTSGAEYGDGKDSFVLVGDEATLKYRGKSYDCERMAAPF